MLLRRGAEVDLQDSEGFTALMSAAQHGHERVVELLLKRVAEIDKQDMIGFTALTEACFLAADRQCTELPLVRLPRLVPEVVGCDPFVPRDLARVGWRGLAPFLPIGPRVGGLASQIRFSRLGQARGASPGSLDQRSEE